MYQSYLLPRDISTTDEEIQKQIIAYGHREWKSRKELYTFLQNNYLQEWRVIGFISNNTAKKWENWDCGDLWLIAKGTEVKYIYSLGIVV